MMSWLWFDRAEILGQAATMFAWTMLCEAVLVVCIIVLIGDVLKKWAK